MQLTYTYEQDGAFLVGHLDQYPEHPTQAYSIVELEAALKEIYGWILDGTLEMEVKDDITLDNMGYYSLHLRNEEDTQNKRIH